MIEHAYACIYCILYTFKICKHKCIYYIHDIKISCRKYPRKYMCHLTLTCLSYSFVTCSFQWNLPSVYWWISAHPHWTNPKVPILGHSPPEKIEHWKLFSRIIFASTYIGFWRWVSIGFLFPFHILLIFRGFMFVFHGFRGCKFLPCHGSCRFRMTKPGLVGFFLGWHFWHIKKTQKEHPGTSTKIWYSLLTMTFWRYFFGVCCLCSSSLFINASVWRCQCLVWLYFTRLRAVVDFPLRLPFPLHVRVMLPNFTC